MSLKMFNQSIGLVMACMVLGASAVHAQERIYRCGNEYTNDPEVAKEKGCKLMEGGNITIIEGTAPRSSGSSGATRSSSSPRPAAPSSADQRARDSDAKAILENELRQAQTRLAQAKEAYAGGQPEKQGIEGRNHQRYLDRVAELKAAVTRAEADVAGIQRELARITGASSSSSGAQ